MRKIRNTKILSVILAVALVLCSAPLTGFVGIDAHAYTDGIYEYTVEDGEATIVGCNEDPSGDIVIPETLGGYPVVAIEDFHYNYYENTNLTVVAFPSTLKTIKDSAFSYFSGLKSVVFNAGLEVIERCAFSDCENLEEIVISDTVTCISDYAFAWCYNLKSVDLGNSVNLAMDYDVFNFCRSIESFSIGEANINYCTDEYGVLYNKNKTGLIKYPAASSTTEYTVDENVAYINEYAFDGCANIKKVNLPDNLISIGACAFYECSSLEEIVIPGSVGEIQCETFYGCRNLEDVTIGKGVSSIESRAFCVCINLKGITIPDTVNNIGWNAFSYCENLETVDLGNSRNLELDYDVFVGCISIESITIGDDNINYCADENGVLYNKDKTSIIRYPAGSSVSEYIIDENTMYINRYAFEGASNLEAITLSAGLLSIGSSAFVGCSKIEEIVIPEGTFNISDRAFADCTNLRRVVIPDSVKSIGNDVFEGCTSLEDVVTGENNENFSYDNYGVLYNKDKTMLIDFPNNSSLESFVIPDGVTTIADEAFYGCNNLKSITISDSVTTVGSYAFSFSFNLANFIIPDTVTSIGYGAFYETAYSVDSDNWENGALYVGNHLVGANNISGSYTIKPGTKTIANGVFNNCEELESITIPDGVTHIGNGAFSGCSNLLSVSIPDGVTDIGSQAFSGCSNLLSVSIPDGVTHIGSGAFSGCSNLVSVSIPDSVKNIGYRAFAYCTQLVSIKLPEGITRIDAGLLDDSHIEIITIPKSVVCVSEFAFEECVNLEIVIYEGSEEDWKKINIEPFNYFLFNSTILYGSSDVEFKTVGDFEYAFSNGEAAVISYMGSENKVVIPEEVEGSKVTTLGSKLFKDNTKLSSVVIPETVTHICNSAFYNCTGLKELTMPSSTTIENSSFYKCANIEKITITKGTGVMPDYSWWTDSDNTHYEDAPWYISRKVLKEVVFEDGVTKIGALAFIGCEKLEEVVFPDSVVEIGAHAFSLCNSLTSVVFPKNLKSIGYDIFDGCENLAFVEIPDSVEYISGYAFLACQNLWHALYMGTEEQYNNIPEDDLPKLYNVTVHYGTTADAISVVETVDSTCKEQGYILYHCSVCDEDYKAYNGNFAEHLFKNGVCTSCGISEENFIESSHPYENNCDETWTIYKEGAESISVTFSEDTYVEYDCDYIYIDGKHPDIDSDTWGDSLVGGGMIGIYTGNYYTGSELAGETITIPGDTVEIRLTSDGSGTEYGFRVTKVEAHYPEEDETEVVSDYEYTIKNGKVTITKYTGSDADVIIPSTIEGYPVTSIGDEAFFGCDSLTSIIIPDSVTNIGDHAFYDCYSLTSVIIGDSVTSIGDSAFYGCTSLTSVTIPDSVTSIGCSFGAFSNCTSLESVTIGDSVTSICEDTFSGCTSLASIKVDEDNAYYSNDEYGVLYNKDKTVLIQYPIGNSRTTFGIPDSVTSIGGAAFSNCTNLESVTIGDSVKSIESFTFLGCTSLISVTIGNSVESIDGAFMFCDSLTSVTIPDSVTSIGDCSFVFCSSLTDVYYNGTEEEWKEIEIGSDNEYLLNATIHFLDNTYVTVRGAVTSYGNADDVVTITLTLDGEAEPSYTTTVTGTSTQYSFENVEIGTYTITVLKANHATRTYTIEVVEEDVTMDVKINLIGDITGDGKVNTIDVARANAHAKGVTLLSDYSFICSEINGDGNVNTIDVARINAHAKGVRSLW